jgi:two-component system chemotaxis response regulator CheB
MLVVYISERINFMSIKFIAIGGSLGSLKVLKKVLAKLPSDFPIPIAIVVHRQIVEKDYLITLLQKHSKLNVIEAQDKMQIKTGVITIAPAGFHLLIDNSSKPNVKHYALMIDEAEHYALPAIDVLFEAVADHYGNEALAVVLTGGGNDGAKGCKKIIEQGGKVLVQCPTSAESAEMPAAAISASKTQLIYQVDQLANELRKWAY